MLHRKGHSRKFQRASVIAAEVMPLEARQMLSSVAVWITPAQVKALPMAGDGWKALVAEAQKTGDVPKISDQDSQNDTRTYARALVGVRTNDQAMIARVVNDISRAIGTENGGRTLALARNLVGYISAAGVIDLDTVNPTVGARFRTYLQTVRNVKMSDGYSLIQMSERRPNNWGTHGMAARIAADLYLNDGADLARAVTVYRGWLGDRGAYSGFKYDSDLSWQSDKSRPVGINPKGATIAGRNVDGVLPDDQRRGGSFRWPPPKENYVYEALQGAIVAAELLYKAGYKDVYQWSDQALLRAYTWLHTQAKYPAEGDDRWQISIVNLRYGSTFPTSLSAGPGKNMGFTAWTHQR